MKQRFLLLLLVWFCFVECKNYANTIKRGINPSTRQWGGMQSNTGDNFGGWLVRVRSGGVQTISCCGAYFMPLLVITSANCIAPFRYQLESANVVTTAHADGEEYSFSVVDTVYTPEDFEKLKTNMDIALVRLKTPLQGFLTEFIRLTNSWPSTGMTLLTFGWGFDSLEVQPATDLPRKVRVTYMELDECKSYFESAFVADTILCTQQPVSKYSCIYDGGSPLVWRSELIGVASVGSTCRNTSVPGLYTSINILKPFIEGIIDGIRNGALPRRKRETLTQWKPIQNNANPK